MTVYAISSRSVPPSSRRSCAPLSHIGHWARGPTVVSPITTAEGQRAAESRASLERSLTLLTAGLITDSFSRRRASVACLTMCGLVSAVGGEANRAAQLVAGRVALRYLSPDLRHCSIHLSPFPRCGGVHLRPTLTAARVKWPPRRQGGIMTSTASTATARADHWTWRRFWSRFVFILAPPNRSPPALTV